MCKTLTVAVLSLAILFSTAQPAFAVGREKAAELASSGTRKQLSTIVFAGLAGAVLGLSTLSFYGRPQDRLNNIAVGAAIGIIGGAVYTTFRAATEPHDFYNGERLPAGQEVWALQEMASSRQVAQSQLTPTWAWRVSF